MIEKLFQVILGFVIGAINVILTPLYNFLSQFLIFNIDGLIDSINNLINLFINYVPYVANLTFIPAPIIHLIASYLIFKYSVKFSAMAIKITLRWYKSLH